MFSASLFLQNQKISITTKVIEHTAKTLETEFWEMWRVMLALDFILFFTSDFLARGAMFNFSHGARICFEKYQF